MTLPTYDDLTKMVETLKVEVASVKSAMDDDKKEHKAEDDKKDKDLEANFKAMKKAMKDEDREHKAQEDDKDKVKDAFKKAEDESDPEKKKEAMKKAMDEKDDYDKKKDAKKAESERAPTTEKKDPERDAKIATLENKYKEPLIEKILQATRMVNPSGVDMKLKQLTASSLKEVEEAWEDIKPFVAGFMPETSVTTSGMIPFQASAALDVENPSIFTGSVENVDWSKVPTAKIMEMYG